MKNRNLILVMILIVVLFNSIVYSALNSEMFINGEVHIRVNKDIRISDIKVLEQTQGSYEIYNNYYSKDTTSMQITLPSSESVMIYEITITNKGTIDYEVTNILEESYSNSNIKYELINIEKGTIIDKETTHTFKIKFTTTENNSDNNTILVLKYVFQEIIKKWSFDYTGKEQEFIVPYDGVYKLETWGASGNVAIASNVTIGYGGYSKGEVILNKNDTLNVVVGGVGISAIGNGTYLVGSGGYNGGGYGKDYSGGFGTGGGGGATHIATITGVLSSLESYKGVYSDTNGTYDSQYILIVAGGGGGVGNFNNKNINLNMISGSGGGFIGGTGSSPYVGNGKYFLAYGGNQTTSGAYSPANGIISYLYCGSAGSFGKGSDCNPSPEGNCSGGGGGFYGGSFNTNASGAGGGGSGYIGSSLLKNKTMYGYKVNESDSVHTKTISIDIANELPIENTAKIGNGYAKITLIAKK